MALRFGADIGGTFTDLVLIGDDGATFELGQILTTPRQPDDAVIEGVDRLLDDVSVDRSRISTVVHGPTLFTNALIERKGAKTALVTTRGFRDALEIGREHRCDIYFTLVLAVALGMERLSPRLLTGVMLVVGGVVAISVGRAA